MCSFIPMILSGTIAQDLVTTLNCVCDACPSYPRIYSSNVGGMFVSKIQPG